jgi:membrane protease YdiL (CAAX protease family)
VNEIVSPKPSQSAENSVGLPWVARRLRWASVQNGTATFGKWGNLLAATGVTLAIPYAASVFIALGIPFKTCVDPSGYWFLQTLHQVAAAALTVVVIRFASTRPLEEWGFNLRQAGKSFALVAAFAAIAVGPLYLLAKQAPAVSGSISKGDIVAILATHFLVIGTTQEILYRGFVMGFLQNCWGRGSFLGISHAGWWAAAVFVVSHIKPYPPFVWPAQLAFSLFFGLLYARIYDSTRSLLGPALAHGFSNTAYVVCLMFFNIRS